jgi:diguanylate cyclase (GGDEF)-like protein/PAS domain S-box-containing protein
VGRLRAYFIVTIVAGYSLLLAGVWILLYQPVSQIEASLQSQIETFTTKSELTSHLLQSFGYGGFIHHFKNYVIRKDEAYLEQALLLVKDIDETLIQLDAYLEQDQYTQSLHGKIEQTYHQYRKNLIWMSEHREWVIDMSTESLDNRVRVDDAGAVQAIHSLMAIYERELQDVVAETSSLRASFNSQLTIWVVTGTIIYWLMMFSLYRLYMLSTKRLEHLKAIHQASPFALVLTKTDGHLLEVNHAFMQMFNLLSSANIHLYRLQDFLPGLLTSDKKHYMTWLLEERGGVVEKQFSDLKARKQTGEPFQVELTVSEVKLADDDFVLLIIKDKSNELALKEIAERDYLTRLYNRRYAKTAITHELQRVARYGDACCLLLIDIDHFKSVNDALGHDAGDRVIVKVVALVENNLRKTDMLARWGGDELVVLLPNTSSKQAAQLSEKMLHLVSSAFETESIRTTISIGIAQSDTEGDETVDSLFKKADSALYYVKNNSRNHYHIADHFDDEPSRSI